MLKQWIRNWLGIEQDMAQIDLYMLENDKAVYEVIKRVSNLEKN